VLAKHVLTDKRLKHDPDHGCMFQHDRVTGHMATATRVIVEKHDVNLIEWLPKGADLNPIELCFGKI
jgi:hypothetical protein